MTQGGDDVKAVAVVAERLPNGEIKLRCLECGKDIYRGPEGREMRDALLAHLYPGLETDEIVVPRRDSLH